MAKASDIARKMQTKQAKKKLEDFALRMTATVPNQATLDDVLLREPDAIRRNALFEFMLPALRFKNARCPEDPKRIIEC